MGETRTVRVKREEHRFTCHDAAFSPWKILVGCFDWEDYDQGKHGIERYRTSNLPTGSSSPGLYELGLVSSFYVSDRGVRCIKSKDVIVVYLGEADNVRIRLQHYGRAGSHLDHGNSIRPLRDSHASSSSKGPGLFKEVFSKGFSIAYRWAQVDSKRKAVEIEAQLLTIYDYAWNKGGNGTRRRDDILSLLDKLVFGQSSAFNIFDKFCDWKPHIFGRKKVGIEIDGHRPSEDPDEKLQHSSSIWKPKLLQPLFRSGELKPHLASKSFSMDVASMNFEVALVVDENKGIKNSMLEEHVDYNSRVCGVQLEDGSICLVSPVLGRKRCMIHKGSRLNRKTKFFGNHKLLKEEFVMDRSFVSGGTGLSVKGENEMNFNRMSFLDESKKLMATEGDSPVCGKSINECISDNERKVMPKSRGTNIGSDLQLDSERWSLTEKGLCVCGVHPTNESNCRNDTTETLRVDHPICGVSLSSGSVCQNRPIRGRKRCSEHKGMRIARLMTGTVLPEQFQEQPCVCGVHLGDGSICMSSPAPRRKRCERHKGRRVTNNCSF